VICWEGVHLNYAIAAVISVVVLNFQSVFFLELWQRYVLLEDEAAAVTESEDLSFLTSPSNPRASTMSIPLATAVPRVVLFKPQFKRGDCLVKFMLVVISLGLPQQPVAALGLSAGALLLFLVWQWALKPSNVVQVNIMLSYSYVLAIWSMVVGACASATFENNTEKWLLYLLVGWACCFLSIFYTLKASAAASADGQVNLKKSQLLVESFLNKQNVSVGRNENKNNLIDSKCDGLRMANGS